MTVMHAAALHFVGKSEAAKKRVQKLKSAGLIAERQRRVYEPSVLHLTVSGIQVLDDAGILAGYPTLPRSFPRQRVQVSEQTLRHELEVMDVKSAFTAGLRRSGNLVLNTFTTWPLLHEFAANRSDGKQITVKPDGFIHFHHSKPDSSEQMFFLEVDRGTESQGILAHRAACYREHYRSGDFAARHGGAHVRPQDHPFRVLFALPSAERRNNTAERMLMLPEPIGRQACLTTFAEVMADPLGKIWITPTDYRLAVQGTAFDVSHNGIRRHRNAERERLVDERINKRSLLE